MKGRNHEHVHESSFYESNCILVTLTALENFPNDELRRRQRKEQKWVRGLFKEVNIDITHEIYIGF